MSKATIAVVELLPDFSVSVSVSVSCLSVVFRPLRLKTVQRGLYNTSSVPACGRESPGIAVAVLVAQELAPEAALPASFGPRALPGNETCAEARVPVIRGASSCKFGDGLALAIASMWMGTENNTDLGASSLPPGWMGILM